jgi:hypothetical protein
MKPSTLTICILLLLPVRIFAQSNLEIPQVNSVQNGIGLLSGWKCRATRLTVTFNNSEPFPVMYGSPRGDTLSVCGHSNTGFGFVINWNLLGDGRHTVRVFDDGVEFANATFRVITPGVPFLRQGTGRATIQDFPRTGEQTTVQWQESTQSFVMVGKSAASVRDVEGRYDYRGAMTTNTCSFAPPAQQVRATFRLSQEGSALRATSGFEGGVLLSGEIEPGQEFALFSQSTTTNPSAACTQRRTLNLEGNFSTNDINLVYDYQFTGTCSANNCKIIFSGQWDKENPFPFPLPQETRPSQQNVRPKGRP